MARTWPSHIGPSITPPRPPPTNFDVSSRPRPTSSPLPTSPDLQRLPANPRPGLWLHVGPRDVMSPPPRQSRLQRDPGPHRLPPIDNVCSLLASARPLIRKAAVTNPASQTTTPCTVLTADSPGWGRWDQWRTETYIRSREVCGLHRGWDDKPEWLLQGLYNPSFPPQLDHCCSTL